MTNVSDKSLPDFLASLATCSDLLGTFIPFVTKAFNVTPEDAFLAEGTPHHLHLKIDYTDGRELVYRLFFKRDANNAVVTILVIGQDRIQREDRDAAIFSLYDTHRYSQPKIAEALGVSQSIVSRILRLRKR